jgi:transcriptional regulator with XRE-family HTH domain
MKHHDESRRCEGCGALLSTVNHDRFCAACARSTTDAVTSVPDHPPEFWQRDSIRTALTSQNFGRFLRVFRKAHDPTLTQAQLGDWIGLSQGQVSRIENSAVPVRDLDKLSKWATTLRVPTHLLWFRPPHAPDTWISDPSEPNIEAMATGNQSSNVKRRVLLKASSAVAVAASVGSVGGLRAITERECAEKLAWQLWQNGTTAIHASELPLSVAAYLGAVGEDGKLKPGQMRMSPEGLIIGDRDNYFSFAQPSLVDFYVAQHIFGNITAGQSHLLATAQTSHATDLVLQKLIQQHESGVGLLARWMRDGATPVLQVNSAGILAKLGNSNIANAVITRLKRDRDTRQLYLTAVANRVFDIDWGQASNLAALVENSQPSMQLSDDQVSLLVKELANPRDGAARWCSVVFLGCGNTQSNIARTALHRALQEEPCAENLRSIAHVLIDQTAFTA